jgi:hypothetical protein
VREGRRKGVGLLDSRGAAAVPHGARTLPLWGTALGLLASWDAALGFLPPCPTAAGIWPHRAVQPTVGTTPNIVSHAVGYDARCTFLKIFDLTIYFSKIKAK